MAKKDTTDNEKKMTRVCNMTVEELETLLHVKEIASLLAAITKTVDGLGECIHVSERFPVAYRQDIDMLMTGKIFFTITSDPDVHFIKAAKVGERLDETLVGLGTSVQTCPVLAEKRIDFGKGKIMMKCPIKTNKIIIRRIVMLAADSSDWAVLLWALKTFDGGPKSKLSENTLSGMVRLHWKNAGSCIFHDSGEIYVPYEDLNGEFSVHVSLLNEGPTDKKAGKGMLRLLIFYELVG